MSLIGAEASSDAQPQMVGSPPGEAIRGPSRSSTALDLEPTAQADPQQPLVAADVFGRGCPFRSLAATASPPFAGDPSRNLRSVTKFE
jgi:hypothetical protein